MKSKLGLSLVALAVLAVSTPFPVSGEVAGPPGPPAPPGWPTTDAFVPVEPV